MTAMGYNTVAMTWSDTYSSIQTGIVNGSVGQTALGVYSNLRDVVNYFIPYNFSAEFVHLCMSDKTYQSLTTEQQQAIQDAAGQVCQEIFDTAGQTEAEGLAQLESTDIEILNLTDEERGTIADYVRKTVWPSQEDALGQDVMNAVYADLEACASQ